MRLRSPDYSYLHSDSFCLIKNHEKLPRFVPRKRVRQKIWYINRRIPHYKQDSTSIPVYHDGKAYLPSFPAVSRRLDYLIADLPEHDCLPYDLRGSISILLGQPRHGFDE